jgi:signal peptidase I
MDVKKILRVIGNVIFYSLIVLIMIFTLSMAKSKKTGEQTSLFGYKFYTVLTGSMKPTINPGSLVIVKESKPDEIKSGDIITFGSSNTDNVTTHRVKKVINEDGVKFITQGDANNVEDPMPIESGLVYGKVINFIPIIGATMNFVQVNTWILWIGLGVIMILSFMPSSKKKALSE